LAVALVAGGGWALLRDDDDRPPAGAGSDCPQATVERRPLDGFGEVAIRVTGAAGEVTDGCALLAADEPARARGLMGQQDLRGYDGMLFRYPGPGSTRFYMRDTLIPLSIAFFAPDGTFVSSADMTPCPPETETCPLYAATAPYQFALEVPAGDLPRLGVGPGSVLTFPAPEA
jgi:uncharacterized membrane protein (UPF0127 family)